MGRERLQNQCLKLLSEDDVIIECAGSCRKIFHALYVGIEKDKKDVKKSTKLYATDAKNVLILKDQLWI